MSGTVSYSFHSAHPTMTTDRYHSCKHGLLLVLALVASSVSWAQEKHDHGMSHTEMDHSTHHSSTMDVEPSLSGQYAFETISEIVSLLRANPETDWTTVDIARLREHLVDMHNVTIKAKVSSEAVEDGAVFEVTSDEPQVIESIHTMISAHTEVMSSQNAAGAYHYASVMTEQGARLTVTADSTQDTLIIRALGFHGIMAEGDHHRHHHWMLATGRNPH